jgi:hypothetical protein
VVRAAAGVVGAAGAGVDACDAVGVVCVFFGGVFCAAAVCVARWLWLAASVAVAEGVVVRPAVVPLPGEDGDPPELAATMTMISATNARNPVSALCREGQDLPRCGW